jgi:hypothetical protein
MRAHEVTPAATFGRLGFGIDREMTARCLRAWADDIAAGRVSVESVRVQTLAVADEFTSTLLRLKLFEPREVAPAEPPKLKGPRRPPHCDDLVLHAPGECKFCDWEMEAQAERVRARVNFTGHRDADKVACPSELRRSLSTIERWGGNRAAK